MYYIYIYIFIIYLWDHIIIWSCCDHSLVNACAHATNACAQNIIFKVREDAHDYSCHEQVACRYPIVIMNIHDQLHDDMGSVMIMVFLCGAHEHWS